MPSTILCVDDLPQVLALRKANLEIQGYSVVVASSGYDAIKILQNMSVDAVLVEYKNEGMDAEAVASHIKGRHPNLPIILLSAYADMSERILWLVDDYVMKSASLEELVRIVDRATHAAPKKPLASQIPLPATKVSTGPPTRAA